MATSCASKEKKENTTNTTQTEYEQPNILFFVADDASMKSFGAYGSKYIKTPAIDALAKEGATFTNAYNCNPKCAPARACLLTGKYSWQLKEATNHNPYFPEEFKFYPELLGQQAGYFTGFTGKGWGPGLYKGKHNPAGPEFNKHEKKPPFKGISKNDYAANFADFLSQKPEGKPFCFWFGVFEPHRRYELDSWKKTSKQLADADVPPFYPDNETVRGDLLDYANEVEWYDTQVGRAIKILEEKGLLYNTLILISSDHGMPFPRVKGQIYEEGFHVPLIAYWKGVIQPGRSIDDFVNFPDIAPTFMEVAGLKPHEQMTGNSILELLKSDKSGQIDASRDHVLLGKERHDVGRADDEGTDLSYPVRAIRNKEFLYVHNIKPERWPVGNPEYGYLNCDGSPTKEYLTALKPDDKEYHFYEMSFAKRVEEELYNMQNDPHCMNNLALSPEYSDVKQKLRTQMEKELIAQGDPRMLGKGNVFDEYPYFGKRLNYKTGERYLVPDSEKPNK
ncbi:sulfatase [Flavivirga amylovorans]